ncbi:MAG: mRNA interferase MazF2 [Deltaproteobacteria bacterium]|nr:MAG: mRNA interferase MazF2 [Deltaproteobacteria bacterium]
MVIQRGEIWWANLPEPQGSEPGYKRPLLIVQSNEFNRSNINTVIAAVITSNLRLEAAPGNVKISKNKSKLPRDSIVNVSQIITVDKSFLIEKAGRLPMTIMSQIEEGIRLVLNL